MKEKYYIDIDENRKILGRYLTSIHGENIPSTAKEVSQEVFESSIQENHNCLNEDLTTCIKDVRTPEEIAQQESEILAQQELDKANRIIQLYEDLAELGVNVNG